MTDQYKDQYQKQYNREITQIHAPQSLIERTKAAMREEEKRLAQAAVPSRKFSTRSWVYPLTAAAALLILVSVSMTMRGLTSKDMAPAADTAYSGSAENGAVYEAAADTAYEDRTAGAPAAAAETPMMEEEAFEEAAAEDMDMMADMAESAAETDSFSAVQNAEGAESADAGQTNGGSREESDRNTAAHAEEKSETTDSEALRKELAISEKEEAASEKKSEAADLDSFTIEKVTKRPARFSGSDAMIRRYEGKTFRILEKKEQENSWEAYVEMTAGEGYVICGEAESVEDFLAGAWEKLEEEK